MPAAVRIALLIGVSLYTLSEARVASAQHFGRNKVEYVDFDFKVFETEHFAVYHYPSEETGARIAARLAERWYTRLSSALEHKLDTRQPLILYGSHPEFAQTNVVNGFLGEGIGGVTESARRRIVMPFAPTLAETDRILGHELTHAFQFDMARRYRGGLTWPLWAIEGLAQYLSLGASDAETSMWLRDAVGSDLLPQRQQQAARKFSPYRYGHALWAYMAGRFGDRVIPEILKARSSGAALDKRIERVTGVSLDRIFEDWRKAAHDLYAADSPRAQDTHASRTFGGARTGRLYLGPSLSPDGRKAIFFSEKDRLSLDLFLADTTTGTITRKLATTAAAARFESLQAIRSAGSWSPEGDRFVFAAVERGQPTLVLLDMIRAGRQREIRLPQFGQILTPSWSPDGRAIAFSALEGGITDVYVYHLDGGRLERLTNDAYSDLQPEWSPDGERIAFVTDRFSSDLATLRFGPCELAVIDLASGVVAPLEGIESAKHLNPHWSADGRSVYFVSDPTGISNVYRLDLASGGIYQVTDVPGGVAGLASTSPALSVAHRAPVLAFTVYRKGQYAIEIRRGVADLAGVPLIEGAATHARALPPVERADDVVERALQDSEHGLPEEGALKARAYTPNLFLEAMGPPYISSGGGPFGTFVRGGGSLLFSDLLGERKVAMFAQAGNRLRDLALGVRFINRERRWNWGGVAEVLPSLRRLPRTRSTTIDGLPTVTRETHYFERTQFRLAGLVAYPLDQTQRLEFEGGARHTAYRRSVNAISRALSDGAVISRTTESGFGGTPATVGEATAAYVRDTAAFGPTSPVLGVRSRVEVTTTFGELSATRVLLDYRRYMMPVKPYTVAARLVHLGQYGPDAADVRLLPNFLGSRQFLRGYGWNSLRCQANVEGECSAFEELLGSRLLVGNLELRAPLMGIRSRDLRYGPVPVEGFLFADSGLVWARSPEFAAVSAGNRLISSFGLGVRVNAFGLPLELAAVRAMDAPSRGWSFDFSFRSGF
jgi:hypothetical protein